MEKHLPEELADRAQCLERECLDLRRTHRHMKQFVLTVNKDNQVALNLLDSDRRPRIFLGLEPDGLPRLRLQDKDGNSLFQAPMEPNPTLPSLLKP